MLNLTSARQALTQGAGRKVMIIDISDGDEDVVDLASEVQKRLGKDSVVVCVTDKKPEVLKSADISKFLLASIVSVSRIRTSHQSPWPPVPKLRDQHLHFSRKIRVNPNIKMLRPHRWGHRL
jgi:hypothetical protein